MSTPLSEQFRAFFEPVGGNDDIIRAIGEWAVENREGILTALEEAETKITPAAHEGDEEWR